MDTAGVCVWEVDMDEAEEDPSALGVRFVCIHADRSNVSVPSRTDWTNLGPSAATFTELAVSHSQMSLSVTSLVVLMLLVTITTRRLL